MKRNERKLWYELRKTVTTSTINVDVPMSFSEEGKQGIHELLTIQKNMYAACIEWNNILNEYCIGYYPARTETAAQKRKEQENANIAAILNTLTITDYTWNGYKKEAATATETETKQNAKENETMKNTSTKTAAAARNVKAIENANQKTELACKLIADLKQSTSEEDKHNIRLALLSMLVCRLKESGKIEGIPSIDGNAATTEFCLAMRNLAVKYPELNLVCGKCYAMSKTQLSRDIVQITHARNAMILSEVDFPEDELALVPIPATVYNPFCRVDEDGDMRNKTHALNILKLAKTHAMINFGFWYKNRHAVYAAIDEYGKPGNVELIFSVPNVSKDIDRIKASAGKYDDKVFAVFNTLEEVNLAIEKGFVRCNGIKCLNCGFHCYRKQESKVTFIAELLRK